MTFGKTGSHVSMIVSFVVFVTFIVFLFFILQPALNVGNEKDALLDSIEASLLDYLSSEINIISTSTTLESSCVQLNGLASASGVVDTGNYLIVKNENGNVLNYDWESGNLKIQNTEGSNFFKIYESEAITSSESSIGICTPSQYNLGLVRTEEKIFEENIVNAISLYKSNYEQLKQNIELGTGDFGFDFVYDNGTIITSGETSQMTGVFTKQSSFVYLDTNLNRRHGNMVIKTW